MKKICNIYIGLWCLYYLQGTLYQSGSILSRLILGVLLFVSLYCFLYAILHYKLPPVLKVLALLVGIWTIYGSINIAFGNGVDWVNSFEYLKSIYTSLLPIFAFYVFAKKDALTENTLRYWVFIFIPIGIAYYNYRYSLNLQTAISLGSSRDEFTNSAAYIFVSMLPIIPLFYKKPFIQYIILGVCMLFVLLGMKRGALLTCVIAVVWFLFSTMKAQHGKQGGGFWRFLLTIVIIIGAIIAVRSLLATSDYFNTRIEQTLEGDSSGRDAMFTRYSSYLFSDANAVDLLVGAGADGTLRLFDQYAHNDWLEIAINNGIIVLIIFGLFIFKIFQACRKSREHAVVHQILTLFFITFFLKTFFSMSYNDISIFSSSAFALAISLLYSMPKQELK